MHKARIIETTDGDGTEKSSRSVVTRTVEKTGGCRTTTTTFKSVTKDGIDSALSKLDIDPEKFRSGGTSVTKTIVYTDSSGKREVIEETVENYGDPDKLAKDLGRRDFVKEFKNVSKTDAGKMGTCFGKDSSEGPSPSKTTKEIPIKKVDPSYIQLGKFEEDCLKAHNEYRKKHGVLELVLSKEMCAHSKEWVNYLAETDAFKHRTQDKKYGENIFMKWSSDPNHTVKGNEPVDSWYSEIKDHVFGKEPKSLKSGHFTQVMWKESKRLGVAWARSKSGKILVVANYDPAGNFIGNFAQNVPPPKK